MHKHTDAVMAAPGLSSAFLFVRQYPITLCVFSLLFMPSVYRLLLFFSPLLISTAIFIAAMMCWGPAMSPQSRVKRGKRTDWAFNESLKIYDDDDEEEGEADDEEVQEEAAEVSADHDNTTQEEDHLLQRKTVYVKADPENKQEPDPDDAEKDEPAASMATAGSASQAEPDPDLHEDGVGAGSCSVCSTDFHEEQLMGAAPSDEKCYCAAGNQSAPALEEDDCVQGRAARSNEFKECNPSFMHAVRAGELQNLPAPGFNCGNGELESIVPDQPAAAAYPRCNDADHDHTNYHDAISCLDYEDNAEINDLDYHDADQLDMAARECAVRAESKARHAAASTIAAPADQSEQRGIAGRKNRASYKGDRHDSLAQQLAERLQTLQAAA